MYLVNDRNSVIIFPYLNNLGVVEKLVDVGTVDRFNVKSVKVFIVRRTGENSLKNPVDPGGHVLRSGEVWPGQTGAKVMVVILLVGSQSA